MHAAPAVLAIVFSIKIAARGRSTCAFKNEIFLYSAGFVSSNCAIKLGVMDSRDASSMEHKNDNPTVKTTRTISKVMNKPRKQPKTL